MDLPETRYVKIGEVHIAYQTVGEGPTDLALLPVAGSGIAFEDRGERALKGLPESWRLFSVIEG
jgi:hypothetical protein